MKNRVFTLTAGTLLCASSAFGQIWVEINSGGINGATDAGSMLATANITSGVGPLTNITGALTGLLGTNSTDYDADMFCIRIDNPMTFSATSLSGDTVLALFDLNGVAIAFNDDRTDSLDRDDLATVRFLDSRACRWPGLLPRRRPRNGQRRAPPLHASA